MQHFWNIIVLSIAAIAVIWWVWFALLMMVVPYWGGEAGVLALPLVELRLLLTWSACVTIIVALVYWGNYSKDKATSSKISTQSEMIQYAIGLLEADSLPSALPQTLRDELSLTPAKAYEISRTAIKRWQAQG